MSQCTAGAAHGEVRVGFALGGGAWSGCNTSRARYEGERKICNYNICEALSLGVGREVPSRGPYRTAR
eukprot:5306413-Prymnesium_polylepis.1